MAETIDWQGESGKTYKYWFLSSLDSDNIKAEAGNYMFVKQQPDGWVPVYIGQSGDLRSRIPNHPERECADEHGATHGMAHTSPGGEQKRKDEEADLISYWNPPCNQQHRTQ